MEHRVAVLSGDGIGPEIMAAAIKILKVALGSEANHFSFQDALVGGCAIDATASALPPETISICEECDAVLFGSVGGPKWENLPPEKQPERGALLPLRKHFRLFANLRPVLLFPELVSSCPLKNETVKNGLDILIIRELTGGIYFGHPKERKGEGSEEYALDTMIYHRYEIERIAEVAFNAASKREKRVCSIDKANVLNAMVLWREVVIDFGRFYNKSNPAITLEHMYVDNAAMQLILNPNRFDVILCPNMFGDILSDEASALSGSLGMLASASLSDKNRFGLYEPSGGSAPDIAGKGIANPIAQILSAALMMRYTFENEAVALKIEKAVRAAIKAGARTFDIAAPGEETIGTQEMAQEIAQKLE